MSTYYDLVLGIIPLTFVGIIGAGSVVGVALSTTITAASVLAAGFIIHAMFINPPNPQQSLAAEDRGTPVSQRHTDGRTDLSTKLAD